MSHHHDVRNRLKRIDRAFVDFQKEMRKLRAEQQRTIEKIVKRVESQKAK